MLYVALAVAAGLIGLDQLTKILVDSNMELGGSIPIISFPLCRPARKSARRCCSNGRNSIEQRINNENRR